MSCVWVFYHIYFEFFSLIKPQGKMRAPGIMRIALVVFIMVGIILAAGLTSLLLLDINVSVGLYHPYLHVMAQGRNVYLKRNMDVMGVRKDNAV